jgi:peroxiredoxin
MDNVNILRTGFVAPEFSLTDTRGQVFSLKDNLADRYLAVCFFPAGADKRIKGYLKDLNSGLPATSTGVQVNLVAISPDRVNLLVKLVEELKLAHPVLSDPKLDVSSRYYVTDSGSFQPSVHFSVFVIDDELIIRHRVSEIRGISRFDPGELRSNISGLI